MNRKTKARAWKRQLFVRRKYNELYKKAEMITISKHLAEIAKNPQPDIESLFAKEDSIFSITEKHPSTKRGFMWRLEEAMKKQEELRNKNS